MSALSIDFAPQYQGIEQEKLADVIQLPVRRYVDPVPVAKPASQPIKLTARGKLMVQVVASVVALSASIGIGAGVGMALREPAGATAVVTVAAGETLWSIAAAAAAPGEDVREVVAEIASLNSLSGSAIVAGQQLVVPSN